jgi:peptide subunit release factor 1 (eRF1)
VDEEMYLPPLLEAIERQRECLVVLADSHRGRIFGATPNETRLIAELDEVIPKQRRASGQRRGKEQGHNIERRRQDAIGRFHRDLAGQVEKAWAAGVYRGIVLLGPSDTAKQFRNRLPQRLAEQVLYEGSHAWNGRQPQICQVVESAIAQAEAARTERVLGEMTRRLEEGYGVAAGPQEVLDALRNGRVQTLVLGPDPGLPASRCTTCGWVFAGLQPTCRYCKAPCDRTNLWQQLLSQALRHNVGAQFVPSSPRLDRHAGVAALLSRES